MGLNPLRSTRQLVANLAATGEDGDEPQQWDSQSRTSRLRTTLSMYKYLVVAVALFLMAVAVFLFPVLPSAHRNYWLPVAGLWLVSIAITHIKSRGAGIRRLGQYHLNILFMGNSVQPRLGKRTGAIDDKTWGLKVLKRFSAGGLRTAFEQFHDRYSRSEIGDHKEKYHRVNDDGSGDVVRGVLGPTTAEADEIEHNIDIFDGISVTHAGAEDETLSSKERDTVTTLPPTIDERTSAGVRKAFASEVHGREIEARRASELEDYVDDLEEYVDAAGQPIFERVMQAINQMQAQQDQRKQSDDSSGVDLPDRPPGNDRENGGY